MMKLLIAALLLGACGSADTTTPVTTPVTTPTTTANAPALAKDDEVLVAVLLHEIAAGGSGTDEALCIATRGATDPAAILAAVRARHPSAVDNAECSGGGPVDPVILTATRAAAARFDVGPVEWVDDHTASANGGGAHRGGGAVEIQYTVEHSAAGWTVTSQKELLRT